MVFFNYSTLQVAAKVVYYGPALAGKTTNLQWIFEHSTADSRGEMVSLATETDRTLFFDLLPLDVGTVAGFKTRIQLYTVPGQVFYNTTRKLVLKGVDGVVFVADSQRTMFQSNVDSLRNLEENLQEMGIALADIPLVFQYNKRDLPNVSSLEELNDALNRRKRPCIEATAVRGDGVFETLTMISKETLVALEGRLKKRHRPAGALPENRAGQRPRPKIDPDSVLGLTAARPDTARPDAARPDAARPDAVSPGREASVVLIAHPRHENLGSRYRLPMHICIEVGRSSDVDISLPGVPSISPRHARLNHRGDVVQIEDLGSDGGTFVNDQRVNGHHFLESGDVFQIGAAHFKFLHDEDPEQAYQRTIYQLYMRDGLTGVFNRGKLFEELEREVFHAQRHQRPLSLVLFDVDRLRHVNQLHGRLGGDSVLQQVARLTAGCLLPDQAFARLGDEEFAILSPETDGAAAMGLAEQIRVRISEADFVYREAAVPITCTFGVAEWQAEMLGPDDLYAAAARELAQAKNRHLALRALVGQNLGRYCIESSLGRGTLAEVYQARDTKLKRDVAIKVILPAFAEEAGFQERFEHEARQAAALDHPHIVPIYDIGEQAGLSFLVMPWIQGGTLDEKLGGKHPLPEALALLDQLASALDEAHATGVLHHDVKPRNVLVGKGGRLLLADFGLAKLRLPSGQPGDGGAIAATPVYMAPEVAAGDEVVPASDLYSLAVIAYELAAGKPPFTAASQLDVLHQHAGSPVPLLAPHDDELPAEIDRVFARALAKDPADRPSSCRAFVQALADCGAESRREDTVELEISRLAAEGQIL